MDSVGPEPKSASPLTNNPRPSSARVYDWKTGRSGVSLISGLGYYELRLNGQRVGDHVLDPGWTTYSKRVLSTMCAAHALRGRRP